MSRALSNVADEGLLTEGFFWIPSLAGPTSLAAQKTVRPQALSPPCMLLLMLELSSQMICIQCCSRQAAPGLQSHLLHGCLQNCKNCNAVGLVMQLARSVTICCHAPQYLAGIPAHLQNTAWPLCLSSFVMCHPRGCQAVCKRALCRQGGGFSWLFSWQNGAPPLGWPETIAYLVLPVGLVVSQYVTQRILSPPSDDPQQQSSQAILKFLPLMIGALGGVVRTEGRGCLRGCGVGVCVHVRV